MKVRDSIIHVHADILYKASPLVFKHQAQKVGQVNGNVAERYLKKPHPRIESIWAERDTPFKAAVEIERDYQPRKSRK